MCFQVPTLVQEKGLCIVISPLIALMNDQVASLQKKGIKAIALVGAIREDDVIRHFDNLQFGKTSFLYMSPERLQNPFIQNKLKQLPISLIAIDEAHCISEWGHDFRPSYLKIALLRELLPQVPVIALTATATQRVVEDIAMFLKLETPKIFKKSLRRKNIHIKIISSEDKLGNLLELLENNTESVIVYAFSRKNCKQISDFLNRNGLKSTYYHAGLSKEEKDIAYSEWLSEEKPIIVATNAFGMGIDKANVRMVIHLTVPSSLENYVQEIGRAGRDGKPSKAIMIEEASDLKDMETFYLSGLPDVSFVRNVYNNLNQFFKITYGDLPQNTFSFDLASFCSIYNLPIVKTYNSLQILEREAVLVMAQYNKKMTQLVFRAGGEILFTYYKKNPIKEKILKILLRTYEGIYDSFHIINLFKIAQKTGLTPYQVETHIYEADKDGIVKFVTGDSSDSIRFLQPREDKYTINIIAKNIKHQKKVKIDKYKSMLAYISNETSCRNTFISSYFDQNNTDECGVCDICMQKQKKKTITQQEIATILIEKLAQKPLTSRELVKITGLDDDEVLQEIRLLLDTNRIVLNSQNEYLINTDINK